MAKKKKTKLTRQQEEELQKKKLHHIIWFTGGFIGVIVILLTIVLITDAIGRSRENENAAQLTSSSTDSSQNSDTSAAAEVSQDTGYSPTPLDEDKIYYADIDVKDKGTITVELDQHTAPVTAANFVNLAESGFYDGLTFHRIMSGFMIQGGDPQGNGYGGSDNTIVGEFSTNGHTNNISHVRGTISMARNAYDNNSASSQFFIVHQDSTASLDGMYAGFGHVTSGMEIVDEICAEAKPTDDNGTISKEDQPIINSIKIRTENA